MPRGTEWVTVVVGDRRNGIAQCEHRVPAELADAYDICRELAALRARRDRAIVAATREARRVVRRATAGVVGDHAGGLVGAPVAAAARTALGDGAVPRAWQAPESLERQITAKRRRLAHSRPTFERALRVHDAALRGVLANAKGRDLAHAAAQAEFGRRLAGAVAAELRRSPSASPATPAGTR